MLKQETRQFFFKKNFFVGKSNKTIFQVSKSQPQDNISTKKLSKEFLP